MRDIVVGYRGAARRVAFCIATVAVAVVAAPLSAQEFGPADGHLVIVGGSLSSPDIIDRFIEMAGGLDARIVVIPTAGGAPEYDQSYGRQQIFQERGAANITILHTYDPAEADTEAFVKPLLDADGVWFTGGRQWRLADAYRGTRVHEELNRLLDRGGVIGGSSAGATIQGEYLARGDTRTNTIMMGDHEDGLAFLRGVAIDQHLLARNRHFDLIEIVEARPELLGIGLDENTAIVVQGDRFEVLGESYVAIYDHDRTLDSGGRFYFLRQGDVFDMKERRAYRPRGTGDDVRLVPLGRITEEGWDGRR